MSKLIQAPKVELEMYLKLNAAEAEALHALTVYGITGFLEVFYDRMGKTYLKPHEAGLRSLFQTIGKELPPIIKRHDAAMKAFALKDPVVMGRAEFHERLKYKE